MDTTGDVLELQRRANAAARAVAAGVGPDHLAGATPCPEWDTRTLLNHLTGLHRMTTAMVAGGPVPDLEDDHVGGDPPGALATAVAESDAALRGPGVLERTFTLPWGDMSGEGLAGILMMDTVIHAWDLAKATAQPTALDPELCEAVLAQGRTMMTDEYRGPGRGFGPEVPVPADAPACDRLAGFYGRQP